MIEEDVDELYAPGGCRIKGGPREESVRKF